MKELILYFQAVLEDGDYMNDWITHLPNIIHDPVLLMGETLSHIINLF